MKNVRVFYRKKSLLKFVSHLDMNRFMMRMLRQTNIPLWYTEGFNSHAYINFALPLSLGFESDYEVMDLKLTDDNYSALAVTEELKGVMPEFLEIIKTEEPVFKTGSIAFAKFEINFEDNGKLYDSLKEFLASNNISVLKKNKKGIEKEFLISDKINGFELTNSGNTVLEIILAAGSTNNVNPTLLLSAFAQHIKCELPFYSVNRTMLYTENMEEFK